MKKRIVIMSYVKQDRLDEVAGRIGSTWTRLDDLLEEGKLKHEVVLNEKETDETALLCYSSGKDTFKADWGVVLS